MVVNLCVVQGSDFSYNFQSIDADDTYETSCSLMLLNNHKIDLDSTIDIDGIIGITINESETIALDPSVVYYYRIRLESISGEISFPFEGSLRVIPTITRI